MEPFATKFVPVTVSVVLPAPAGIVFGLSSVIVGAITETVATLDVADSLGFCTVMLRLPVAPSMVLGMVAVIDVAVTAEAFNAVVPT